MRPGLALSAATHTVILAAILVGFGNPRALEEPPVDAITVDLVPVASLSKVRPGDEASTVVKTETPSIVKDKAPAKLAQPTGNTEKDQQTPQKSDTPKPAPTVNSAPEPAPTPEPAPKPAPPPAPAPAPKPAPEPKPEPAPAPVAAPKPESPPNELAIAPTPATEPTPVAPKPASRTTDLASLRADFKKQQEAQKAAETKPKPAVQPKPSPSKAAEEAEQPDSKAARAADEISQLINQDLTRGATTGAGGSPTLGKTTGRDANLAQSVMDALASQMAKCWNVPIGAVEAGIKPELLIELNPDGTVRGTPQILSAQTTTLAAATAQSAVRAVLQCQHDGYRLPPDAYDQWQQVDAVFDPKYVY